MHSFFHSLFHFPAQIKFEDEYDFEGANAAFEKLDVNDKGEALDCNWA